MSEQSRVLLVEFFLSLGVAWFVCGYLYKRIRLDAFREELFTVRDNLFDYMQGQGEGFDNEAYRLLRESLNGMIRAAGQGSFNLFTLMVCLPLVTDPESHRQGRAVVEAIAAVPDPAVRARLQEIFDRVGRMGLWQIWLEGPLSLFLTPLVIARIGQWKTRREGMVEVGVELSRRERSHLTSQAA